MADSPARGDRLHASAQTGARGPAGRIGSDQAGERRPAAGPPSGGRHGAGRPRRGRAGATARWQLTTEHVMVALLCLLVLEFHDVGYLLRQPYWNDEAWVAVTTRFPLTRLPSLTSSTPIGWSFLLRLFTVGRSQSGRLLPLTFAALAVIPAYWLARRLDWRDRGAAIVAGALAAAAVLLVPAMLVRDDLKQYTADAFMTLAILAATARLERQWSRRGLVLLSVAIWGGMLLSDAAAFAGAAVLGALCLVQLARRDWRRLADAVAAAAATALLGLGVYLLFDARAVVPGLTRYWQDFYVPVRHGMGASMTFVVRQFELIHGYFGLGPAWLAIPLVLAGLVTIARLGRPATAVAVAALWPEMLVLAALRKYPFLDLRTSTFLITITAVVAAIGVAGICALVRAWLRGGQLATAVAIALAAVALLGFGLAAGPYVRSHLIPFEPIRQQTQYAAAHAAPADPIVVSANSNWGFAYYWPEGTPATRRDSANLQLYQAVFPSQSRIIVVRQRDFAQIKAAMTQAMRMVKPGTCSRIWLVRTHENAAETAAWTGVLSGLGLTPRIGPDGVAYIQEGPASCS
jgi:hypothetical protein